MEEAANSEIAQRVMNHFAESMQSYGTAMNEQAKNVKEGFYLSGKYSGVTGSDQTGASIHGFRDDTSYKTPNDEWTDAERRLYEFHQKNNPKEAEAYAIRVNDRYNQNQKQKKMDEARQQMNEKEVLALEAGGARVLSGLKSLDGYNSLLEYSATGRISTNPEISPGEYSQLIDDTIADKIERNGDKLASDVYRFGTKAIDDIATYAVGGPVLASLRSAGESAAETLWKEKANGATDKEAATRAFMKGTGEVAVDLIGDKIFENMYIEKPEKRVEKIINEGIHFVESSGKSIVKNIVNDVSYDDFVEKYKKQGFTDKHAKNIATFEMMKKYGGDALKDVAIDVAQRKFEEALKRKLSFRN